MPSGGRSLAPCVSRVFKSHREAICDAFPDITFESTARQRTLMEAKEEELSRIELFDALVDLLTGDGKHRH